MFIGDDGLGHGALNKQADRETQAMLAKCCEVESMGEQIADALVRLIDYKIKEAFEKRGIK